VDSDGTAPDRYVGTIISDRYRLVRRIGVGGMGVVYEAEHTLMKKALAIKLLHPELGHVDQIVQRFEREAQSASRLSHPGIIQVTDFGKTEQGELFLVMEFLIGESLAETIAHSNRIPVARATGIMRQVLAALDHAHGLGVIHRDLKPENIMLTRREDLSERDHVKLLDFGIAKLNHDAPADGPALTQAGIIFGTPSYMSPEQAMGQPTCARSDLYSCGVILYEMVTGKKPFVAEKLMQVISMHLTVEAKPARDAAPDAGISEQLSETIRKALAKRPEDRFATALEFLDALEGRHVSSTLKRRIEPVRAALRGRWRRLSRAGRWTAAGVAAALCVAAIGLTFRPRAKPLHPKLVAPDIASALKPAEAALERGDVVTAKAILLQRLPQNPGAARVHYLLGTVEFLDHQPTMALQSYRECLRLDPGYRADPALLQNVESLVDDKRFGRAAVEFLGTQVGEPAAATLASVASTDKRPEIRHDAYASCERIGCLKQVDKVQSMLLDLAQAKSCDERKAVVVRLKELGDVRALEVLKKERRHSSGLLGFLDSGTSCMRKELDDAIRSLEARRE
jgi:tRNA A-37 threonylcarbamoyl transferase component Bud32